MAFHLAFGVYVIAFIEAILLYGESSAALAKESQTAIAGDASVHLPCYYDKPAGSVDVGNVWLQWRNEELILLELKLFSSSLASYLSVEKYSVDDDGRMVIHNVTIEDEGKYLCLVNWDMKDYYITQQTEVNLRVLSPKREVYLHLEPSGKRQNVTHGTAIQLDQSKDHVIECSAANDDRETQLVWDVQPSILNTVIVYGEEDIKTSRLIILADNETGIITCTCSLNRPPLPPMTTSITVELIKPSEKKTKKNTENRRDRKKRRRRPADSSHPKRRRKPANLPPQNVTIYTVTTGRSFTIPVSVELECRLKKRDYITVLVERMNGELIQKFSDKKGYGQCEENTCIFIHRGRKRITIEFKISTVREEDIGPGHVSISVNSKRHKTSTLKAEADMYYSLQT